MGMEGSPALLVLRLCDEIQVKLQIHWPGLLQSQTAVTAVPSFDRSKCPGLKTSS